MKNKTLRYLLTGTCGLSIGLITSLSLFAGGSGTGTSSSTSSSLNNVINVAHSGSSGITTGIDLDNNGSYTTEEILNAIDQVLEGGVNYSAKDVQSAIDSYFD